MSRPPFLPTPRIALMTPDKARDIARGFKSLAEELAEAGSQREALRLERDAQWWLTYAIVLAQTSSTDS